MQWQDVLIESGLWLAKAYALTLLIGAAVAWGLTRFTRWGRQFRRLSAGYFSLRRSWKPLAGVALILLLTLAAVRLDVLFSNWYNTMYSALQALDEPGFWAAMLLFSLLAADTLIHYRIRRASAPTRKGA